MTSKQIWNRLKEEIKNDYGVAGLMGNLQAESGLRCNNLQNSFNARFNMSDDEYTAKVDNGEYKEFIHDCAGYGLAQWTYWSRKQNLLNYAKSCGTSIGDEDMQIDFLIMELKQYKTVWQALITATSVRAASDAVLLEYERPYNQGADVQETRAGYGMKFYEQFAGTIKKSVNDVAAEVLAGKWGNGEDRRKKLTAAGYNYDAVQARVNELCVKSYTVRQGDTLDGIARKYGTTYQHLADVNGIKTPALIYPGQVIKIK